MNSILLSSVPGKPARGSGLLPAMPPIPPTGRDQKVAPTTPKPVLFGALSLLLLAAPPNIPVRITVEPGRKTNPKLVATAPRLTPGSRAPTESLPADLPNTVALYYHVKVANVSPKQLKALQVRWTILWVDEASKYRLTEGTQTCDIAPVRTFEFDTDAIGVRSPGSSKVELIQKQDVAGYLIEAVINDIVVASEGKPKNIEPFIARLRTPAVQPR